MNPRLRYSRLAQVCPVLTSTGHTGPVLLYRQAVGPKAVLALGPVGQVVLASTSAGVLPLDGYQAEFKWHVNGSDAIVGTGRPSPDEDSSER